MNACSEEGRPDRRYVEIHAAAQAVVAEVLGVPFQAAGVITVQGVDVAFLQMAERPAGEAKSQEAIVHEAAATMCGCYARARLADYLRVGEPEIEGVKKQIWNSYLQNERQAVDTLAQSASTPDEVKAWLAEANRLARQVVEERWLEIRAIAMAIRVRETVVTPGHVRDVIQRIEDAMAQSGKGRDDDWAIMVPLPPEADD